MNGASESVERSAKTLDAAKSSSDVFSAERLAEAIDGFDPQKSDANAAAGAKAAVTSAIGLALVGCSSPTTQALLKTSGVTTSAGQSLIFGTDRHVNALDAALVNATAAGAGGDTISSAYEAALVVGLLALGEERKSTGKELVDALVVGADTAMRLRQLFPALDVTRSSSMGAIAFLSSTAAASRMIKLDFTRATAALLIAATFGGSTKQSNDFGLPALEIGHRARASLLAVLLAEAMDESTCAELVRENGSIVLFGSSESVFAEQRTDGGCVANVARNMFEDGTLLQTDLWDEFEKHAKWTLAREQVAPLFERLETIDKVADLAAVTRLMQTRSGNRPTESKVVFAPRGTHEAEETNWVP